MGLTREVREFFTQRIYNVLDSKIAEIQSRIDEKKVRELAIQRFCEKWGLSQGALSRYAQIRDEIRKLEEERDDISSVFKRSCEKAGFSVGHWSNVDDSDVARYALQKEEKQLINELYPTLNDEIEALQKIKGDIQGTVLLATTEAKLVARLTAVLQRYGGSIEELLEYIPE